MVVANLHEALEIYVNLGEREIVVRTIKELTEAHFWAGRFTGSNQNSTALAYLRSGRC
jgi:hypothetical protein